MEAVLVHMLKSCKKDSNFATESTPTFHSHFGILHWILFWERSKLDRNSDLWKSMGARVRRMKMGATLQGWAKYNCRSWSNSMSNYYGEDQDIWDSSNLKAGLGPQHHSGYYLKGLAKRDSLAEGLKLEWDRRVCFCLNWDNPMKHIGFLEWYQRTG